MIGSASHGFRVTYASAPAGGPEPVTVTVTVTVLVPAAASHVLHWHASDKQNGLSVGSVNSSDGFMISKTCKVTTRNICPRSSDDIGRTLPALTAHILSNHDPVNHECFDSDVAGAGSSVTAADS